MFQKIFILFFTLGFCHLSIAQQVEELSYADQLRILEEELDSLSIFNLLDSVLFQLPLARSELNARYGFTSSVTSAGRDYNIQQTGYSGGLSYFHKSGTYLDISSYWSSQASPKFNPTILSTGYLGSISEKWGYSIDYEHWFYNPKDSSENPLTNSLGASVNYDFKIGYVSLDYSHLFGKEHSNRFIGSLTSTLEFDKFWFFKGVKIFPTATIVVGNGDVTTLRITTEQISTENQLRINTIDSLAELTDQQIRYLALIANQAYTDGKITLRRRNIILNNLALASSLTDEELAELNQLAAEGVEQEEFFDGNSFGVLNYSFTLPISFTTNKLSILLSYTYSIPVKLPGEIFDVEPIGYFGASILYRIPFK